MELTVKRVTSLVFLAMLVALAPRAWPFRAMATSLLENNGATNSSCDGGMAKCLIDVIVDEDRDWEFMTGLGISRMLVAEDGHPTFRTVPESMVPCDRGFNQPYRTCTPKPHKTKIGESCDMYKRNSPDALERYDNVSSLFAMTIKLVCNLGSSGISYVWFHVNLPILFFSYHGDLHF
ncbi:hypothetical protein CJ030_MR6G021365 [Morella rubra]|uniref:Uncharacterized protein n=1 Tax=Morella rubra TaxID=262757 RepID=A0A6A1VFV4_9ROSI|nr:hypothetical protein CJ030_MR6G021365 [Morella rubra]